MPAIHRKRRSMRGRHPNHRAPPYIAGEIPAAPPLSRHASGSSVGSRTDWQVKLVLSARWDFLRSYGSLTAQNILLIQGDPSDARAVRDALINSSDGSFDVQWVTQRLPGHAIGHRLLQSVARRLQACVRSSDTVSGHGGDEFVILLTEVAHAEDAAAVADKALFTLRSPHHINQYHLQVTGSIRIVTYPDDGTQAKTLMNHADLAMYHAKECGRDNDQFFEPELNVRAPSTDRRQSITAPIYRQIGARNGSRPGTRNTGEPLDPKKHAASIKNSRRSR
jgi:hypothetical protein